ncbi:site-2 protease family protein [Clostridium sp.]|uniref:site-2 protease family protein n=1 Tax=Clostridium sp. TaxID=1506 RepID=UPI00261721BF|nr:site-2 protease family protein [Clostridium sp.]
MRFLLNVLLSIPAILIAFSVKEYTRAKMADKLGDKAPRFRGELTLDPLKHIDIMGALMMALIGFGWTKSVNINKYAFKNPKKDAIRVNAMAWFSNLGVAVLGAILFALWIKFFGIMGTTSEILVSILRYIIILNVNLFVFNILPLPGLDCFRILEDANPKAFYKFSETIYKYYTVILIAIIFLGSSILSIPSNFIMGILQSLINGIL